MGYIKYLIGEKDELGRERIYYRFFDKNYNDITEYFNIIGKRVKLKYFNAVVTTKKPEEVYRVLNHYNVISFYSAPGLKDAQHNIDKCNYNRGCDICCSAERRSECRLLRNHANLIDLSDNIKETMRTPVENYVKLGNKKDYDKKCKQEMTFESFDCINESLLTNKDINKYKIIDIVSNGNTVKLIDKNGKQIVMDVVAVLGEIRQSNLYVVNLETIRNWEYFK